MMLQLLFFVASLPSGFTFALTERVLLEQYTPDQADWSVMNEKAMTKNSAHDPDSVFWMDAEDWEEAEWDGTTIYNPSKMSKTDFWKAICPSVDRIRGIREVFYQHNPFADKANPTKAEVDEWHRIAINHARALIGYTGEDRQVKKDHCMFARALWGDQRKKTDMWDAKYPGTLGSAYGPCLGSTNAHCGATFIPDADDQAPYLPQGHAPCTRTAGSEGVFNAPKSNIPWSVKWSRALCNTLISEGFWGGHVGPFFHREKFGFSFWDQSSNFNSPANLRAKWTGQLMPSLYCNPSDDDCDVNATGPQNTCGMPPPGQQFKNGTNANTPCHTTCSTSCFENITCGMPPPGQQYKDGVDASTPCGTTCDISCFKNNTCGTPPPGKQFQVGKDANTPCGVNCDESCFEDNPDVVKCLARASAKFEAASATYDAAKVQFKSDRKKYSRRQRKCMLL